MRTRRLHGERGASMVEYTLLIVLIALLGLSSIHCTGIGVSRSFDRAGTAMDYHGG